MSLLAIALAGILALSAGALLLRASSIGSDAAVVDTANLASSESAVRERHDALGRLDGVAALDPADFAGNGTARERHDALGRLDGDAALDPDDFAGHGTARERHDALGRLDATSP